VATKVMRGSGNAERSAVATSDAWEAALAATTPTGDDPVDASLLEPLLADVATRAVAIRALANAARIGELGEPMETLSLVAKARISTWLSAELSNSEAGRRAEALEIVAVLKFDSLRGRLMQAAHDDERAVRVAACRALAVIDPRRAIGELLRLVETDGEWTVDLLTDIIERYGLEFIDPVLNRVETWASTPGLVALLASTMAPTGESVLVTALGRQDSSSQIRAAAGLGAVRSKLAVPALQRLLQSAEPDVRSAAVRALGAIGQPGAISDLTQALGDEARPVRFGAATSLLVTPGGRDVLLRASKSTDPFVAEAAGLALCQTGIGPEAA
jgi:HEAT repeats